MFALTQSYNYYLYRHPCDMRKGFNGLCGLIVNQMGQDPINGATYIFINKNRNKLKILRLESGGFILYYKRLEEGTFEKSQYDKTSDSFNMEYSHLLMMIEGISVKGIRKRKRYNLKINP